MKLFEATYRNHKNGSGVGPLGCFCFLITRCSLQCQRPDKVFGLGWIMLKNTHNHCSASFLFYPLPPVLYMSVFQMFLLTLIAEVRKRPMAPNPPTLHMPVKDYSHMNSSQELPRPWLTESDKFLSLHPSAPLTLSLPHNFNCFCFDLMISLVGCNRIQSRQFVVFMWHVLLQRKESRARASEAEWDLFPAMT